jgi:hypothetical protein
MLGSAGNQIRVFLGDGKGGFKALPAFAATLSNFTEDGGFPYHMEIADLNGDHAPDLVITKGQYSFKTTMPLMRWMVLLGRGDGTFTAPVEFRNPAESRNYPRYSFALVDVNGDQRPDVVFLDDRTGQQIGVALNATKAKAAPSSAKPPIAGGRKASR